MLKLPLHEGPALEHGLRLPGSGIRHSRTRRLRFPQKFEHGHGARGMIAASRFF
jgi:hypothetical protein